MRRIGKSFQALASALAAAASSHRRPLIHDANGQNWMVASGSAQTPPQVFFAACDNTCSNPVDLTNYALDLKAMYNWGASHFATVATTFTNSSAVISATNHFHSGDRVQFATTGALPTNFSVATDYWISATGLSGTQFEVSATQGGSVITAGSAGSGTQTTNHFYLWDANEWFVGVPFGNEPAMNGLATPITFTNGSAVIGGTNVYQAGDQLQLTTTGTLPTNFALNTTTISSCATAELSSSQFESCPPPVAAHTIVSGSASSGTNTAGLDIGSQLAVTIKFAIHHLQLTSFPSASRNEAAHLHAAPRLRMSRLIHETGHPASPADKSAA